MTVFQDGTMIPSFFSHPSTVFSRAARPVAAIAREQRETALDHDAIDKRRGRADSMAAHYRFFQRFGAIAWFIIRR
ncbi:MAG TPA: hypothetical protein VKF40_00245 [Burkholderiales bacterium]|nr:hypothetical protein [Burkholderiales bacterium]